MADLGNMLDMLEEQLSKQMARNDELHKEITYQRVENQKIREQLSMQLSTNKALKEVISHPGIQNGKFHSQIQGHDEEMSQARDLPKEGTERNRDIHYEVGGLKAQTQNTYVQEGIDEDLACQQQIELFELRIEHLDQRIKVFQDQIQQLQTRIEKNRFRAERLEGLELRERSAE
ncbi:hypothetical protein NHQ30_010680 [Ciborinia camelliae]|nr:hypothetical protein NHQ30_010680 [Ciborinia camelliae]